VRGATYQARLFIHAKYPERIRSPWIRDRLLDFSFRPEWNSVEVVQAILSLLQAALNWRSPCSGAGPAAETQEAAAVPGVVVGKMVIATESCVPLYALQEAGKKLFAADGDGDGDGDGGTGSNSSNSSSNSINCNSSWLSAYHTPQGSWEASACFRAVNPDVVPSKVRHTIPRCLGYCTAR
jgi:hypothetical protein